VDLLVTKNHLVQRDHVGNAIACTAYGIFAQSRRFTKAKWSEAKKDARVKQKDPYYKAVKAGKIIPRVVSAATVAREKL